MNQTPSSDTISPPVPIARGGLNAKRIRQSLLSVSAFLAAAVIFGLSYTQSVLYEGNQNTKFLHGLARAGRGLLREDWLANTVDPLPAFSFLVYLTARINENLFYVYYILLFGVYVYSLLGIASLLYRRTWNISKTLLVFTALLLIHARWVINLVQRRYGISLEFLQYGLAQQYLLGEEFQNSVFGVFLLLSVYLFLQRRYLWAVIWLGLACILHSAYLFSGALITLAYLAMIFRENLSRLEESERGSIRGVLQAARQPFGLGLLTFVMVLPVLWYNQVYLSATSAEISEKALSILVNERIPHHALPRVWLTPYAYVQMGIMLVGLILARKSRLFPIMGLLFLGGAIFTLVQILTNSNSLAMIAPWRVSVLLVPLAVTLILAALVNLGIDTLGLGRLPYQWLVIPLALWAAYTSVRHGLNIQEMNSTSFRVRRLEKIMDYVKQTKAPGDVYLVPPKEPLFDDFRLYTGAPIFVNWKSHPYKDSEVLEWYARVQRADEFYDAANLLQKCELLQGLIQDYPITHVVIKSKEIRLPCAFTTEVFRTEQYALYKIGPP